jgi:hypothetical protein
MPSLADARGPKPLNSVTIANQNPFSWTAFLMLRDGQLAACSMPSLAGLSPQELLAAGSVFGTGCGHEPR